MTGGYLKATRGPSCAAAADKSVTFGKFAVIHAAWVGGPGRNGASRMPRPTEKEQREKQFAVGADSIRPLMTVRPAAGRMISALTKDTPVP